jgi:hypothetical protein
MKTFRLVASLAVFAGLVACHRETDTNRITPASFSLSIERTDKGIAAQCTEGCRWISVTADCAGCVHRIDAAGIGSASQIVDPEISFAFNVQEFEGKLVATSIKGTAWRELSWTCDLPSCSARIDGTGVSPAN